MVINEKLIEYVIEARRSGMSDTDIRSSLVQAGWSQESINEVLGPLEQRPKASTPSQSDVHFSAQNQEFVTSDVVSVTETNEIKQSDPEPITQNNFPPNPSISDVDENKKKKIARSLVLSVSSFFFVVGVGALAYMYAPSIFSNSNPPYNTDTFFQDLFNNIKSIKSASYEAALSFRVNTLDPNRKSLKELFPEYSDNASSTLNIYSNGPDLFDVGSTISTRIKLEEFLSMFLPLGAHFEINTTGSVGKGGVGGSLDLYNKTVLNGTMSTSSAPFSSSIEFVFTNNKMYIKVPRLGFHLSEKMSDFEEKWALVDEIPFTNVASTVPKREVFSSILSHMPSILDQSKLLRVVFKGKELDDANNILYRYDIDMQIENLGKFYELALPYMKELTIISKDESEKVLSKIQKFLEDPVTKKWAAFYQSDSQNSIWISKDTMLPTRILSSSYWPLSHSSNNSFFSEADQVAKQIESTIKLSLSNVNNAVDIKPPEVFVKLSDIMNLPTMNLPTMNLPTTMTPLNKLPSPPKVKIK
jgi:hypothetical protein